MRVVFVLLAVLTVFCLGELLQLKQDSKEEDVLDNLHVPEFASNQRGYAYVTAFFIMVLFAAVVYCHVSSVRKTRLLEQYAQQYSRRLEIHTTRICRSGLPEWSPLLIDRKNIRPPPPYEQVV